VRKINYDEREIPPKNKKSHLKSQIKTTKKEQRFKNYCRKVRSLLQTFLNLLKKVNY